MTSRVPPAVNSLARSSPVRFVDLRRRDEVLDPAPLPPGVEVVRYPLNDPTFVAIPKADREVADYATHYVRLLTDAVQPAAAVIRWLAEERWPVVVGCRLGKDRTGVVTMLCLWALDVVVEDIVTDYVEACRRAAEALPDAVWTSPGRGRFDLPAETLRPALRALRSGSPSERLGLPESVVAGARAAATRTQGRTP
jgi:hypothetical protein